MVAFAGVGEVDGVGGCAFDFNGEADVAAQRDEVDAEAAGAADDEEGALAGFVVAGRFLWSAGFGGFSDAIFVAAEDSFELAFVD